MRLSARVGRIGESATLKVSRRAAELRAQGVEVVNFGAGEPDFDSPAVAVEGARRALAEGLTRYTPASGLPELRAALADRYARSYNAPWSADEAIVTVGAKAALFELSLALFEAGDQVVLPAPCWVSFPEQIRFTGAEPVMVPTAPEDGFQVRAEPLLEALTERTRAVLVNSPANPSGGVIGAADLERVVAECAARDILVVSDETYERFAYEGSHVSAAPLAARHPETVVLVGSFSKTYAMTGWRVGYALGPPEVIGAVGRIQSHATSNPTSFAMAGALTALREAEDDVQRMIATYRERRDFLVPRLNDLPGVFCRPPAGAFYAFPRVADAFREGRQGSVAFAEALLEEAAVAVVPGAAFGADEHVRISFACSRETLEEGLERMADFLGG
ncbi:MAG: pyridoxal phosphate-dependent aminotransferase [Thermoanaerobaculia bacterium]